jgi:hypothetical protein
MQGKKVTAFMMLLALAVACFISATAFSGEHPWDSEGRGGSGSNGGGGIIGGSYPEIPADSTTQVTTGAPSVRPPMDTWSTLVFHLSYQTVRMFFGFGDHVGQVRASDQVRPGSR